MYACKGSVHMSEQQSNTSANAVQYLHIQMQYCICSLIHVPIVEEKYLQSQGSNWNVYQMKLPRNN